MKSVAIIILIAIVVFSTISAQDNLTSDNKDVFSVKYLRNARAAESCDMRQETLSCTYRCMQATITRGGYCSVRSRRQVWRPIHIMNTRCCNGKGTCICN